MLGALRNSLQFHVRIQECTPYGGMAVSEVEAFWPDDVGSRTSMCACSMQTFSNQTTLSLSLSTYRSINQYICLVYEPINLSIYLSIYRYIDLSI